MTLVNVFPLGGAFAEVGEDNPAFGGSRTRGSWSAWTPSLPDEQGLAAAREDDSTRRDS